MTNPKLSSPRRVLRQIVAVIIGVLTVIAVLSSAVLLGYGLMVVFYLLAAWKIEGKDMVEWEPVK